MISPFVRRVAGHYKGRLIPRSAFVVNSFLYPAAHPAIIPNYFQNHQSHNQNIPLQTVRMASNGVNKHLTRDSLFNCKGRVALVTGGGSGIGLMITQTLVANGAKVYITGRTTEKLERVVEKYSEGSDSIIPIPSDITSKDGVRKLVAELEKREPSGLDILVNNAGISGSTLETEASSAAEAKKNLFDAEASQVDDWTDVYRTNVASLFFTTTALLPLLQKSTDSNKGWSSTVVNITSISGLVKSPQHHFQYNASKAAANHLTRMLASELTVTNDFRVRINAIAPGVFPSEMTTSESDGDQKSNIPKEEFENKVPARRPGREEDMAQALLTLVCNQYINGEILVVDGGYTLATGK